LRIKEQKTRLSLREHDDDDDDDDDEGNQFTPPKSNYPPFQESNKNNLK